jgi:putative SOS response-associated peptidase YedK
MCNLYSLNKGQDALRRFLKITSDETGNQPPLPGIYPDTLAPIVRSGGGGRVMEQMRWGFPPLAGANGLVTNVRKAGSSYWRNWLKSEYRCLVPATSFCEWTDTEPKVTHWFALDDSRSLFAFAGIWRPWEGERQQETGWHLLYAFLTTEANAVVAPVHRKAMPVILTTPHECEAWLSAPLEDALKLQRPLPDDALRIVARGEKQDG